MTKPRSRKPVIEIDATKVFMHHTASEPDEPMHKPEFTAPLTGTQRLGNSINDFLSLAHDLRSEIEDVMKEHPESKSLKTLRRAIDDARMNAQFGESIFNKEFPQALLPEFNEPNDA